MKHQKYNQFECDSVLDYYCHKNSVIKSKSDYRCNTDFFFQ